jgi:hypothetical protein
MRDPSPEATIRWTPAEEDAWTVEQIGAALYSEIVNDLLTLQKK